MNSDLVWAAGLFFALLTVNCWLTVWEMRRTGKLVWNVMFSMGKQELTADSAPVAFRLICLVHLLLPFVCVGSLITLNILEVPR
jgi:hypothetical protein